jgi:ubiquinol-cytochrome c reductase cytochrome b subunit
MLIYFVLMAEAFMGYLLPWGQMSYWGAQVIVSLVGALPYIGDDLMLWIRGDYLISGITLNRFFSLHVIALPLVLVGLVAVHIFALHEVGSNNPDGVDIKAKKDALGRPLDGIPFHPYYSVHDVFGIIIFLFIFSSVVFFFPDGGGYFLERPNFEPAILFVLPWLDRSQVKSIRYKGWISRFGIVLFVIAFCILGYLGVKQPTPERTLVSRICTTYYFLYFLLMPFYTRIERTKPVPERVRMSH